jgi:hypothetical protein
MARNGYIDAEIIRMPQESRLKGSENYGDWRRKMMTIATASGLNRFLGDDPSKPERITSTGKNATKEQIRVWKDWTTGDEKMMTTLYQNITANPRDLVANETTTLGCWTTLETYYKLNGPEAEFSAITDFIEIKYEHYRSLDDFVSAFGRAIRQLSDLDISPPQAWYSSIFINCLSKAFPAWADRKLGEGRETNRLLPWDALIGDIISEKEVKNSLATIRERKQTLIDKDDVLVEREVRWS